MTQTASSYAPDELLGVHVVSEQIFCPRAMLVTHAKVEADWGREPPVLRLDYSPSYELQELEERLETEARLLWQLLLVAVVLASLGFILSLAVHSYFLWTGLLAAIIPARYFVRQIPHTLKLLRDHRAVGKAHASQPNPMVPDDEPINWWSLRAAGFVSHPVEELLVDAQLGLQGRPWRILRHGALAIPAFVRNGTDEMRPQQRARIAAYCHLIRVNEGADSPYGIVLDRGTFAGTALKPSDADMKRLTRALKQIPRVIQAWLRDGLEPRAPVDSGYAPCKGCPHGRPVPYEPERSETICYGHAVPVYRTTSQKKRGVTFHSPCGDRFGWIPKHDSAELLELRPASS